MINSAILHITLSLNQYLKSTFDLNEDIVEAANLLDQDGSVFPSPSCKRCKFYRRLTLGNLFATLDFANRHCKLLLL